MRSNHSQRTLAIFVVMLALLSALLACAGNVQNMTIGGVPKYICPSATPRPTSTPLPTALPTYPAAFNATLDYSYIDPTRTRVTVQYLAQNVGAVYLTYSVTSSAGYTSTSQPYLVVQTGNYADVQNTFTVIFPFGMAYGQITLFSSFPPLTFTVTALTVPFSSTPNTPPCCLPSPIYPTPRPTYTPYPTPTPFTMVAPSAFYLDDPIYNYQPPIQLRLRMKSPVQAGQLTFLIPLFAAASWTLEITNVGNVEYDFLGAGYTYVSADHREWPDANGRMAALTLCRNVSGHRRASLRAAGHSARPNDYRPGRGLDTGQRAGRRACAAAQSIPLRRSGLGNFHARQRRRKHGHSLAKRHQHDL